MGHEENHYVGNDFNDDACILLEDVGHGGMKMAEMEGVKGHQDRDRDHDRDEEKTLGKKCNHQSDTGNMRLSWVSINGARK